MGKHKITPKEYFNDFKKISSGEISKMVYYTAFGILTACFSVFKDANQCLLLSVLLFSVLSLVCHFFQYFSIYMSCKKWGKESKKNVPSSPFFISDILFIIKIIFLGLSIAYFFVIALQKINTLSF
jgi:hypothetical protein